MKKIITVALLTLFGLVGKSQAVSITKTISSTTFVSGFAASDTLMLNPKESMTYTLTGSATGIMLLEKSIDGSNFIAIVSSQNNSGGTRTGIEYSNEMTSFYRWRASTMTNAGSFVVTLDDNDDFVTEVRNNKRVPILQFWDDTIRLLNLNKGLIWNDVIPSTATDSRSSGNARTVYLTGTQAALEGSVLVATTPVAGQGVSVAVAPAIANLTTVFGIAAEAKSVNNPITVYTNGLVLALTTGTIVPGDILGTSAVNGYLQKTTTAPIVGLSLANGISAGGKLKTLLK